MITMGVDVGSLFSKAVVLRDEEMVASEIRETTGNVAQELDDLIASVLDQAGLKPEDVEVCVSTGTGGDLVKPAEFDEDDVACLAMATRHFLPEVAVVINIGGQSIATVLSDDEGEVLDFMRNDKCASGSGRYLEVMSGALGVKVDQIDATAGQAEQRISISSQCGVFAESEIVSHVNQGEPVPDIVAGLCDSVASIVISQAMRFGGGDDYTITGGVARIDSVTSMMQERLRGNYHPFPIDPMLAAAYGAAIIGGLEELPE
jgi:(R)-2-hydroxyacyl-CoA dehydratese activating ATPase